jgi:predicted aspartyl protease
MSFRFDPRGNLIIVPVLLYSRGNRETVDLALDTGATRTTISRQTALYLGYELAALREQVRIITGSGMVSVPLLNVDRIEALGKAAINMRVLCHTLPSRADIDGVLGLDFLRDERLVIDFRAGLLALE